MADGLGNQLFRHAAALGLASRTRRAIYYDLSYYTVVPGRKYQMDHFLGPSKIPKWNFFPRMAYQVAYLIYKKACPGLFPYLLRCLHVYRISEGSPWKPEPAYFDPALENIPQTLYVDGYCQHVDYLPDEALLRREFSFVHPPKERNCDWLTCFSDTASVSVHVRRADYLALSADAAIHVDYYRQAAEKIRAIEPNPLWVVFSDDSAWCRQHLTFMEDAVFVDGNMDEPWEDLRLMSACRHHIIANSSFSWWGAYLGRDPTGVTIAPEYWWKNLKTSTCFLKKGWITCPSFVG
ncbi:MAG: alpha-1,2-fucosyltransferase [bacterium]